ncbi:MAG TPA: hypothetical protein VKG84_06560 [Candidatus Acidoferrales bacterium]|nr:hypothetical protein [Candidatus Acidoferrales bacterium]
MRNHKAIWGLAGVLCALVWGVRVGQAQEKAATAAPAAARVYMVVTNEAQRGNEVPTLATKDVRVKLGKNTVQVNQLIPARGDNAALQLIILIDDTLDPSIGTNLNDLRDFISAQPKTTAIGIAYMSNTTISVAQNFTQDHEAAAKAVRLPRGGLSAMDSPYLSLISLVKGWPQQKIRREVLLITDGIDRLRGETPTRSQLGPFLGPTYHSLPTISADVDSASTVSQKAGTIVHAFYAVGVGRSARSTWDRETGLSGITKLAQETGGECFSLGTTNAISFKPYLEQLQRLLDNQYYLVFQAGPEKKSTLRPVKISTEVPNSEISAADNVWVSVETAQKK